MIPENYSTDLFGVKNLFYNGKNEFNTTLADFIFKDGFLDYSPAGIKSYFTFRYPVLENTMFKGYKRLDSSSKVADNKIISFFKPSFEEKMVPEHIALQETEELLLAAIKKLIAGKKRIGIMLSGGLDSSLICAMLKKQFRGIEIYTYSVGFYGEDEFEYSDIVAGLYSDKHQKFVLGKDDFIGQKSILADVIKHKFMPLHPNELPLAIAESKAKKDGCDIVLCGEGADDIFGGYGKNLRMYLNYDPGKGTFLKKILDEYRYFSDDEVEKLVHEKYLYSDYKLVSSVFDEKECPEDIRNQMFYFIQRLHTKGLIERGNNAMSYNGFSQGFPFIDMDLVKYANSLPFDLKVRYKEGFSDEICKNMNYREVSEKCDIPKYILKKLSEKYLPEKIIYRPKYGFPVPFEKWLSELEEFDLDDTIFKTRNISFLNGWKKYMVINLNTFIKVFNRYRKEI